MVSIVIPVYKTAQYVAETLDSVLAQTVPAGEIIVVNDGDPDTEELEAVLAPYMDRIVYVKHSTNLGLPAARNTAINRAQYDLVAILDSDDIWLPNYLQTQLAYLQNYPGIDVVYGDANIFGPRAPSARFRQSSPSEGPVTFESLVRQQCTVLVSVLGRKRAFVEAGLFDSGMRSSEDFDMWLRMLKSGFRIGYHDQVIMKYRARFDSLSSDDGRLARSALQVLQKISQNYNLTPPEQEAVSEQSRIFAARNLLSASKQSLANGDYNSAIAQLSAANETLRSDRLSFVCLALRLAPSFLCWLYRRRSTNESKRISVSV
jgi:glycosyltransferase involved in cell wall biosynthesis